MTETSKMRCPECNGVTLAATLYDDGGLMIACQDAGCNYERGAGETA